jgi:hypothetical protein
VVPEERRVCAFCATPQPLSALAGVATWLQCTDTAACTQRAQASGLYPQLADEQALARHETSAGAPR